MRLMREKVNSDFLKTKVRVRWYGDLADSAAGSRATRGDEAFLELKRKIGGRREKLRIAIPFTGRWLAAVRLGDPRLLALPAILNERGAALRDHLFPTILVRYRRRRYVEPVTGTRVNLDYDIGAPAVNLELVPRADPRRLTLAVVELKGRLTRLPAPLYALASFGCRKRSLSKYVACYRRLSGESS